MTCKVIKQELKVPVCLRGRKVASSERSTESGLDEMGTRRTYSRKERCYGVLRGVAPVGLVKGDMSDKSLTLSDAAEKSPRFL